MRALCCNTCVYDSAIEGAFQYLSQPLSSDRRFTLRSINVLARPLWYIVGSHHRYRCQANVVLDCVSLRLASGRCDTAFVSTFILANVVLHSFACILFKRTLCSRSCVYSVHAHVVIHHLLFHGRVGGVLHYQFVLLSS